MKGKLYHSGNRWFVTWNIMTEVGQGVDILELEQSDYENELIEGKEVDFEVTGEKVKLIRRASISLEERLISIENKLDKILEFLEQAK